MYKTVEIGYHPKASDMAAAIEHAANELAAQGHRVVSFSVTGSAKAIVLAERESDDACAGKDIHHEY
ncbi:hypothetical protein ACLUWU_08645 [Bifidobacterium thermophilum]|uniref:hypothetical protein n=1 Tax=Bifidobacterium thermophilum TaxID=33905 RepID=UPI00399257A9